MKEGRVGNGAEAGTPWEAGAVTSLHLPVLGPAWNGPPPAARSGEDEAVFQQVR
jgi:hypothetical protein